MSGLTQLDFAKEKGIKMSMTEPRASTTGYPRSDPEDGDNHKIKVLYNDPSDKTCATFIIRDEDHTIANPLRYMIMKDPKVELCGYTIPHVSAYKVHMRIQTFQGYTASEALRRGLDNLIDQAGHILSKFEEKVAAGEYDTGTEVDM